MNKLIDTIKKYNINLRNPLLVALLVTNLIGSIIFENLLFTKIILAILGVIGLIFIVTKKNRQFVTYFVCFLSLSNLYGLYGYFAWPIWVITVITFLISWFLINYLLEEELKLSSQPNIRTFYSILLSFLMLEIFISLLPWPTNLRSKGIVDLTIFYLASESLILNLNGRLTFRKIASKLIIATIIIILAVSTTAWYYF